jgi:hypothetical protein
MRDVRQQTLLIPVVFPDPEIETDPTIEGLEGFDITLLGYWEIPGGTTPETAREMHETEAKAVLYEMAANLSRAGASTEIQLHFGPGGEGLEKLQDHIVAETDPDGVLIPDNLSMLNNILVPLRDNRRQDKIIDFVSVFDHDMIFVIELYHAAADDAAVEVASEMLEGVKETLLDRGFSEADIEITVEVTDDASAAIVERSRDHNLVVMGETEEGAIPERFLGPVYETIDEETDTPIAVIRA